MPISFSPGPRSDARMRGAGVTAVLGPTNTGKTHLAIERMLAHSSGIIGLPLRLLAREVYNKVAARIGPDSVALITGEEKIKPANPRYWVSTVEAMPQDIDPAFIAIDEIQIAADFERGHVFTDRILNRRGREETLILGAATVRPMVERLLPGANIISRPRLSQLTFAGDRKMTRLPSRSAIVAFSADEVYAIAELIRRQRGGAAVVLGALSPRTRNAQVALYQSGDVDYLIATDAIGMGLNLDVDHVAFASDRKFDGYQFRNLNPAELAQIAGRAGRATRDGTFGTTGRCAPFDDELVRQLESHSFEPLKLLQWRNSALDFASIGALQASLSEVPTETGLTRAPLAEDILILEHAARDEDIRALAKTRMAVERLWEACQVPDYRKIAPANHAELVTTLYGFLMREGKIPDDWFARQVAQADHTEGDIDSLSTRIAHVRTWTFVANRPDWLADPDHWQGVTRAVEDKLSDALHERLTARFVDRRTSVLMRRLRENTTLDSEISKTGDVTVEGHLVGRLEGFRFAADPSAGGSEAKALHAAAQKALAGEIDTRANRLSQAPDEQFVLTSDGTIRWTGDAVAKLVAGEEVMRPRIRILADEQLTGTPREQVQARLDLWTKAHIDKLLGPLTALAAAEDVIGIARGIAYRLIEDLGVLERQKVAEDVKGLDQPSRASLRKYSVRFGAYHIYIPQLLKPAPRTLATLLYAIKHDNGDMRGLDDVQQLASSGRTSIPANKDIQKNLYRVAGYRVAGERAVRVDILERLADLIRPALAWRDNSPGIKPPGALDGTGFTVTVGMTSLVGSSGEDFASILRSLGYRMERRPKPAEPVASSPSEPAQTADAVQPSDNADGSAESVLNGETADAVETPAAEAAIVDAAPVAETVASEPVVTAEAVTAEEPAQVVAAEPVVPAEPVVTAQPAVASEADVVSSEPAPETADTAEIVLNAEATAETAAAPAEPELIEVWRPGRFEQRERRPQGRHHRRDNRGAPRQAEGQAVAAPADGLPVQAADAAAETPRQDNRSEQRQRGPRPPRKDRHQRHGRPEGGPRHEGQRHEGQRHGKPGGGHRQDARPRPDRREKEPDPNSPFAKLAALKAQLEADSKERR
ncbi:helicase-related protein [Pseudorhodoplanes sinuspersici]|uniref:Helicase n=1 Tax=Pseudorhodoplanes sinuspersici TaxID=1235591 RepID=A0A1W6ZQ65_9HYPH|nr:helicase-related protein [Pseudorhodoplanes sinuspersici]ARP99472.1 helicase [Pseudorhodoplanes sinuspersici]RKE70424.1 ATP-dependent RNA helicase SUPV3L1/SUV3 [Pseudorhodoplanes sinuspersici]